MAQAEKTHDTATNTDQDDGRSTDLHDSPMMAHLQDNLEHGNDIGHYAGWSSPWLDAIFWMMIRW
jgi:hypothetical protein